MQQLSKRIRESYKLFDAEKAYSLQEAVSILKKAPHAKFDETVEISLKLGIDKKQSEQSVRGTVVLPHGTGKKIRVAAFCKGELAIQAKEAGADFVGDDDLVEKVAGGWTDFDVAVSSPDMMRQMGKLGKVLGPRGLMPNPKAGTVTRDVGDAVREVKKGRIEFRSDKSGDIHVPVGKVSFEASGLEENIDALLKTVNRSKPSGAKGQFLRKICLSTTMGPGVCVDASPYL